MPEPRVTFTVQNAIIKYRNFSGRPTPFNKQGGDRSFTILLDDVIAKQMANDGWNVKFPKPGEEEDKEPMIDIKVKYNEKGPRPRIVCVTSTSRFDLDENQVELLDGMDISYADVACNASFYDVNGKTGISAYLKKAVVVIEEDELDRKWGLNDMLGQEQETVDQ